MTKAIAFFPWLVTLEPIIVGPLRLLPYKKKKSPGDLTNVSQSQIDLILKAYATHPRKRITAATILEIDDWQTGTDPTIAMDRLFAAKELLAFASLSERKLFHGHFNNYCCNDDFTLIIQNFTSENSSTFAYSTRRRDGGTSNVWSSDEFSFHRPIHCLTHNCPNANHDFLSILLELREPNLIESIAEFNHANTDSQDVLPHIELVMLKSAFELLFGVDQKVSSFCKALDKSLSNLAPMEVANGPLKAQWEAARANSSRPLIAWAKEFCDRRGVAAHGNSNTSDRFVWSERSHLAFASLLFPLLFKKTLSDAGNYKISEYDKNRLRKIDQYVLNNPFSEQSSNRREPQNHPWAAIDRETQEAEIAEGQKIRNDKIAETFISSYKVT
jgi:hypothetical protein